MRGTLWNRTYVMRSQPAQRTGAVIGVARGIWPWAAWSRRSRPAAYSSAI